MLILPRNGFPPFGSSKGWFLVNLRDLCCVWQLHGMLVGIATKKDTASRRMPIREETASAGNWTNRQWEKNKNFEWGEAR